MVTSYTVRKVFGIGVLPLKLKVGFCPNYEECLIGMNAVLMDNANIGKESIVGALSFVKGEMEIPPRSLVAGNPAKIIKEVSDEMIAWKTKGTELYQQLPSDCYASLKQCEPLCEEEPDRPEQVINFETWKKTTKK